jgi:hypothetical protein
MKDNEKYIEVSVLTDFELRHMKELSFTHLPIQPGEFERSDKQPVWGKKETIFDIYKGLS